MMLETVITTIDAESARLRQVRALIAGNKPKASPLILVKPKRRLSAEGRARIVATQRKGWAKR